jgi:hypothetical protein
MGTSPGRDERNQPGVEALGYITLLIARLFREWARLLALVCAPPALSA